ncbi:MAG TPA: hypothetical protein VMJ93_13160 [Verrucomicrobiae bacterium]|nr:hypothetical protein [Verrucomicrobiae bacterium]
MILLIFFSLLGLVLLGILYALMTRPSPGAPEGSAQSLFVAHHALTRLQQSLLAPDTVERIFSESDVAYVATLGRPEIRGLFLSERRRIALLWVSQIRSEIASLMRFHRSHSGFYANLSFSAEFSLMAGFWSLLSVCTALQVLIYLRGPFATRSIAGRAVQTAGQLCELAGKPISFLDSYSGGLQPPGYPKGHVSK